MHVKCDDTSYIFCLSAYLAFKDIKDMLDNCKKIKEQAKLAYDQVTDAYQQINGTLQDIKEHRDKMAWVSQISDQKVLTTTNITCCTFLRTRFTKNSHKKCKCLS